MIILLSPAKSLTYDIHVPESVQKQTPLYVEHAQKLMADLRKLTPSDIASLMKLSDKLAGLNFNRFQEWTQDHSGENARQAVYLFDGDVYKGLDVATLAESALPQLNDSIRLLSGLYGILRPFDAILPYRLEMGTKFENYAGKNLYAVWKDVTAKYINQAIKGQNSDAKVLVNLASNEYFKSVDKKQLEFPIINPEFKDFKNGQYKIISFFAKRARGLMARYLVENGCTTEAIRNFDVDGYQYNPDLSTEDKPIFTRKQA